MNSCIFDCNSEVIASGILRSAGPLCCDIDAKVQKRGENFAVIYFNGECEIGWEEMAFSEDTRELHADIGMDREGFNPDGGAIGWEEIDNAVSEYLKGIV